MIDSSKSKIWIDLDNSPHVPFFIPIMKELKNKGHSILLTSRDCFQVSKLADLYRLNHNKIGKHFGSNMMLKIIGTIWRSLQLTHTILKEKPSLSLSHGSRSLILASTLLKIPTILIFDYEHSKAPPFFKPILGITPEAIKASDVEKYFKQGVRSYKGLKEDVYVPSFNPEPAFRQKLGLRDEHIVATIRPPATEAHYHNPEGEKLFVAVVDFLGNHSDIRMVILPRNEKTQREMVLKTWPNWCSKKKIIIPDKVVNGLDLIWNSDFVVSGGGTMNREAAALGVPVYSIFRGKLGAVDRYLSDNGRLTIIDSVESVKSNIRPIRRHKVNEVGLRGRTALNQIVEAVEDVIRQKEA
jgi:predicted glycosyltransferase